MLKISSAIADIIQGNDFLHFGLQKNLLNLSQTASYLKPFIEARTKKEVKESAITMNLSRIHRKLGNRKQTAMFETPVVSFTVKTNLCALTYYNNAKFREQLNKFYPSLRGQKTYFVQSQGVSEFEIIIENSSKPTLDKFVKEPVKNFKPDLVAFNVQMHEETYEQPGALSQILQQIAFQGITVYGVSSTYTEFIFNVEEKDLKLTVETLCSINKVCFVGAK